MSLDPRGPTGAAEGRHVRPHRNTSPPDRTRLGDQPLWAAVLLTVADVTDLAWLSVTVWGLLVARAIPRVVGEMLVRKRRARP